MPPKFLERNIVMNEIILFAYYSFFNIILLGVSIKVILNLKEILKNMKQIGCMLLWYISILVSLYCDVQLAILDKIEYELSIVIMLCIVMPCIISLSEKVFVNDKEIMRYLNGMKKCFYIVLILTSFMQLIFKEFDLKGIDLDKVAIGLGITFAIFEFADMKLETKKADEK